jgi:hypothetical protein
MVRLRQPKSKTEFSVFFFLSRAGSGGSGFYSRLNLLGVTQNVFFMVPEETQTSTSSTVAGITSVTECAGGDGPSSAVLGRAGQVQRIRAGFRTPVEGKRDRWAD